jgi:hypothetical protein
VRVLHVEVQGARNGVAAVRDRLEGGIDATDRAALHRVAVLVEEAEAEDAQRIRVGDELLDDQVVVLARLDVGPVLADGTADALVLRLVRLLERLEVGEGLAAALESQLVEGVPRARGGRRSEHLDLHVRQAGIHVLPGLVRVGHQRTARCGNVLGQREKDLAQREGQLRRRLRIREHDAVEADLHLGDGVDAVLGAELDLGGLDAPRGIGDVRVIHADAGAEQLEPATGARALDDRSLVGRVATELLGDHGREGVDGRGTDDSDLVAGGRDDGRRHHGDGPEQGESVAMLHLFSS